MIDKNTNFTKLLFGDFLKKETEIKTGSVDMILTDLPYGVLNRKNKSVQWDNVIPFEPMWKAYERIIKPNGAIILFGQGMFTARLMLSNSRMWRYNLIWDKVLKTGFLDAKRKPLRQHEDIMVFYKKLPIYNPQMKRCSPKFRNHNSNYKTERKNRCYGPLINVPNFHITDQKYPSSIITCQKEHLSGNFYHPTQKPVKLLEYLIRTYTNEGDTVFDSCMGSGSTGVACVNTNRSFIGCEIEKNYYDIAKERLLEAEKTKGQNNEAMGIRERKLF